MKVMLYIAVMAGVTYAIRVLPFTLFKKKIKSRFFRSFLYYTPYAVLAAMTVPAIFTATGSLISATAGFLAALFLSWKEKPLMVVAAAAAAAALLAGYVI